MLATPAIDGFDLLEHGSRVDGEGGPDQRMNRALTNNEVAVIRELAERLPLYRIWNLLFRETCSYHTVRRAATREHYKEQP